MTLTANSCTTWSWARTFWLPQSTSHCHCQSFVPAIWLYCHRANCFVAQLPHNGVRHSVGFGANTAKRNKRAKLIPTAASRFLNKQSPQCKIRQFGNRDQFQAAHFCYLWPPLHNNPSQTWLRTIKQDIAQDGTDSVGQMAGKKTETVCKWYTLGPDENMIPGLVSDLRSASSPAQGVFVKVLLPAVEVILLCACLLCILKFPVPSIVNYQR